MEYIVLHTPRRIKQGGTSSNFVNIEMRWVKPLVNPLSLTESVLVLELDFRMSKSNQRYVWLLVIDFKLIISKPFTLG